MKKNFLMGLGVVLMSIGAPRSFAQKSASGSDYQTAIGLGIDVGDGGTLVGPSIKHFFTENSVGAGELLFGNHTVAVQAFYQYHREFDGAEGLRWFAGGGPSFQFYSYRGFNQADIALVPMGGLDYKIPDVPLSFSFDWRPNLFLTHGSGINAARFGLGFRYAFN